MSPQQKDAQIYFYSSISYNYIFNKKKNTFIRLKKPRLPILIIQYYILKF